jgi:hypothetical protein
VSDPAQFALTIPQLLLPGAAVELAKWPVVACDQYTSQLEYWEELAAFVGEAPSTLQLIFPEVYLGQPDEAERIRRIQGKMLEYLERGILRPLDPGFVLVERRTRRGKIRRGLVVALDLECYDFRPGSKSLIRATEGTVLERIPPRVRIREGAALECPHVLVLIDDPERRVIEPLAQFAAGQQPLYDVELPMNGGHLTGYPVAAPEAIESVLAGLSRLADPAEFRRKYGADPSDLLLYAVGDGNHSLATAKTVWENLKPALTPEQAAVHPARFALVELINLHDEGLEFEPIHRVLFGGEGEPLLRAMADDCSRQGMELSWEWFAGNVPPEAELERRRTAVPDAQVIGFVSAQGSGGLTIRRARQNLAVGTLQRFLDEWLRVNPGMGIDYIHGADVVAALGSRPGNIGFYLPPLAKQELFKTVLLEGALPRKTFSMGEADEKRFYMECRRIK